MELTIKPDKVRKSRYPKMVYLLMLVLNLKRLNPT